MTEYEKQQIKEYGFVKYKIKIKPKQTTWTDKEIAHEEAIITEEKRINNNKTL